MSKQRKLHDEYGGGSWDGPPKGNYRVMLLCQDYLRAPRSWTMYGPVYTDAEKARQHVEQTLKQHRRTTLDAGVYRISDITTKAETRDGETRLGWHYKLTREQ